MKAPRFTKLFAQLPLLNQPQRQQVLEALHPAAGLDRVIALIDQVRAPDRRCCVLVARDRSGHTIDAVTGRGALKAAHLARHLLPKLDPQALLVTDANAAYRAFARDHGIAHQAINLQAGERVRNSANGAIHVQNVNAYHRRFKEWLARFHGVASRRPANYLGWFWALDGGRVTSTRHLLSIAIGVIHSLG